MALAQKTPRRSMLKASHGSLAAIATAAGVASMLLAAGPVPSFALTRQLVDRRHSLATATAAAAGAGGTSAEASDPRVLPALGPLIDRSGQVVDAPPLLNGQSVALYFAAAWCPMCQVFTPTLKKYMEAPAAKGKRIIFVSSDFSPQEYQSHRAQMSDDWLAVPYGTPMQSALKQKFKVWSGRESVTFGTGRRCGVPALVVLDPVSGEELKFLNTEQNGASALSSWSP